MTFVTVTQTEHSPYGSSDSSGESEFYYSWIFSRMILRATTQININLPLVQRQRTFLGHGMLEINLFIQYLKAKVFNVPIANVE